MKVFIGILLLLILLLSVPAVLVFEANPELKLAIKYFGFKKDLLLKEKDGKIKAKKPEKDKKPKEKKQKKRTESTFSAGDIWGLYQKLRHRVTPAVRKLLKRTTVGKFRLRMVVAGSDAAETAIRFGQMNMAVFSTVALVDRIVTLRAEHIDIIPGFGAEKNETSCSGVIRLIPIIVLIAAVQLGFWGLLSAFPLLRTKSKNKKAADKGGEEKDNTVAADGKEDINGKEAPAQ